MIEPTEEFLKRRKSRALVTALLLGGFVVLIFFVAMAKMQVH